MWRMSEHCHEPPAAPTLLGGAVRADRRVALAVRAAALGRRRRRRATSAIGKLTQLNGPGGCLVDRRHGRRGCTRVRALAGPGAVPRLRGDRDQPGRQERLRRLVAEQRDRGLQARRAQRAADPALGHRRLHRRRGRPRLRAGASGSSARTRSPSAPTGKNVYATSLDSDAVAIFAATRRPARSRRRSDGSGCIANAATTGCTAGRALDGADVVAVSPDGANVYVGAFFGNAVAVFDARRVDRRADAAGRQHRLHRRHAGRRLHDRPRAGRAGGHGDQRRRQRRLRRGRGQQRAARARPRPVHRRADAGDRRQRLHRADAPLAGCTTGIAARRRERGRGQPRRRRRLRDVADQQQRHVVHAHGDDRRADAAGRHLGLRDLRARRRLLARAAR